MMIRNPFYKKIVPAASGEAAASYGGIALKSLWFWLLCAAGIAAYYLFPIERIPVEVMLGGAGLAIICPILTYLFPSAAPVTGSIYSVLLGFILPFVCTTYAAEYSSLIYIAVGITALVFFAALLLYRSGIVKVNRKFRGVFLTLLLASAVGSGVVFISSFFTNTLTKIFWGNSDLAMIVAAVSLLLAAINLVFEFDFATNLVQQGMQKRYEWTAAYGLFMTVILIFLRVLELLAKIMSRKDS